MVQSKKVLFPVWELEPFLKVGGLGEVARSLPRALKAAGVDIRLVLPQYKAIRYFHQHKKKLGTIHLQYGKKLLAIEVSQISFLNADIPIYLFGNTKYFDKPIPDTFAVFAGAITALLESELLGDWKPAIVHCNDNHCGLVPLMLKDHHIPVKTLLTIHCVTHQRKSPIKYALDLGIAEEKLSLMRWETKKKQLNFLVQGIQSADRVNTVSPTYLKEIQTEEYGCGIDDWIRLNMGKTSAILNGIDYELRNPATNPYLTMRFSTDEQMSAIDTAIAEPILAKKVNKATLQERVGLPVTSEVSVIGFVGRLDVGQKGIDVLHRMLWREQFEHSQFVIMGHGEEAWEERFTMLAAFSPQRVAVMTKYDEALASLIYAGSDFVLIPSHFEPCCLVQMNAMRYGALPIAHATGGLNDTIRSGQNGVLYDNPTATALHAALTQALTLRKKQPKKFNGMILNAMRTDFSWAKSAQQYIALYSAMLD